MTSIFALLLTASLILMIIGLIKPKVFSRKGNVPPTRGKIALVFTGLSLLFFILIGVTATENEQASPPEKSSIANSKKEISDLGKTPKPQKNKYVIINAHSLYHAYQENEVSADEKFKNKHIKVSGIIDSINKDMFDDVWVGLSTGDVFSSIHAELDGQYISQAAQFKRGQKITLQCIGNGMIIGTPMLKECSIK